MKKFWLKLVKIILFFLCIAAFNYWRDPFFIFNSSTKKRLLTEFEKGNAIAFNQNLGRTQYFLKKYQIENTIHPIGTVVLGSSISQQIGKEYFPTLPFYNASLYGSALKDIMGCWNLIESHHQPKRVILEASHMTLRFKHGRNRMWMVEEANDVLNRLNLEKYIEPTAFNEKLKFKAKKLFSISYGMRGIRSADFKLWNKEDSLSKIVMFSDGSELAKQHPRRGIEFDKWVVEEIPNLISRGEYELEEQAKLVFERWIQYLQLKEVEIILFVPPFYPAIYESKLLDQQIAEYDNFIKEISSEYRLKVVGGHNPSDFKLKNEHFSDNVHFQRSAMHLIFGNSE